MNKEMWDKNMNNYQNRMESIMEELSLTGKLPTLLVQCCCAPCSSAVLERIEASFQVSLVFFNPNIEPKEEYVKREKELKSFIEKRGSSKNIKIVECRYDPQEFHDRIKGLEDTKERGERCYQCYKLRLEETARLAKTMGFQAFATTLTLSPHKNAQWLNEIGLELENKYNIRYLVSDFKKKGGYQRSIELSKEYGLYRQDYCGCIYSKRERQMQKEKKYE